MIPGSPQDLLRVHPVYPRITAMCGQYPLLIHVKNGAGGMRIITGFIKGEQPSHFVDSSANPDRKGIDWIPLHLFTVSICKPEQALTEKMGRFFSGMMTAQAIGNDKQRIAIINNMRHEVLVNLPIAYRS